MNALPQSMPGAVRSRPKPPVPTKPGMRRWTIVVAVAVLLAIAGTLVRTRRSPEIVGTITPPIPRNQLHETGMVEALVEWPVVTRYGGDVLWKIDEGSEVSAGDPVVKFDTRQIEEDIADRQRNQEGKLEAVRRAEAECTLNTEKYKLTVREQEILLKLSQLQRDRLVNSPTETDRKDAELTLKAAAIDLKASQDEADGYDLLMSRGFVSDSTRKKKQLELTENKISYSKAKLLQDLTLQGCTDEVRRIQEMSVADAKKKLQIALFNRDADTALLQAALDAAKIDLQNADREIARKKRELALATVRAPAMGKVAFIDVWKGSKSLSPIEVGETRPGGSDVCKICDSSRLRINMFIGAFNIWRVKRNQKAAVSLTSFPGRKFDAVVSEVGVVATDKNKTISPLALRSAGEAFVNVVGVKLDFTNLTDEERANIRIGMTADVLIDLSPMTEPANTPAETQK